jgi:hypothetical protein
MNDFHEQDAWDQNEVEIVDLGAPDKGFSRYFFTLGEKWHAAAYLRVKLVVLVFVLSLFVAVLQSSSSFVNNQTPSAHLPVSTYSLPHKIECAVAIIITNGQEITWQQFLSTSSSQGVVYVCSSGTPLPIPSGNDGKNP